MIEDILQQILEEHKKTNNLLESISSMNFDIHNSNELLTIEQVKEETGFGLGTVQKMFKDPKLEVQRYTTPFKVTRKALYKYLNENHDYLKKET